MTDLEIVTEAVRQIPNLPLLAPETYLERLKLDQLSEQASGFTEVSGHAPGTTEWTGKADEYTIRIKRKMTDDAPRWSCLIVGPNDNHGLSLDQNKTSAIAIARAITKFIRWRNAWI